MRRALVLAFVALVGCGLHDRDVGDACSEDSQCSSDRCDKGACAGTGDHPDGASCSAGSECASGRCDGTVCLGSDCTCDGDVCGGCDTGWTCASGGSGVFGGSEGPRCVPLCGHCPANFACTANDPAPDTRCTYEGPPSH